MSPLIPILVISPAANKKQFSFGKDSLNECMETGLFTTP